MLPKKVGDLVLTEVDLGPMTLLAPYADGADALTAAVKEAHGLTWPEPGRAASADGLWLVWFGRDAALLTGAVPAEGLSGHAALADQSDGWACVDLSGPGAEHVLARLVPIDLRQQVFGRGQTARTLIGHMMASITRTGAQSFMILVFRSMAGTLVHELTEAMESVHARGIGTPD